MTDPPSTTAVLDAGARYGPHPSWQAFDADLRYLAFEPDPEEAERLRQRWPEERYDFVCAALDREPGERELFITRHRGLCSFLPPDTTSEWFRHYRPDAGVVERTIRVPTTSIDAVAAERDLAFDFLKLDTEGTEHDVLEGAAGQLETNVLGVRISVNFQRCYVGQPLISETLDYLDERGFFLLNLDYAGFGVPRNSFFRKPDPSVPESTRYGVLVSTDGVWLRKLDSIAEIHAPGSAAFQGAHLKYAAFCLRNHAPDVAVDTLETFGGGGRLPIGDEVATSALFRCVRRDLARFLGQWRVCEDALWDDARDRFERLFGLELVGGSEHWEQVRSL